MKRFITILLVFAVALLFFAQSDTLAKTEKNATKRLNPVSDGEVYDVQKPKAFKYKSICSKDDSTSPRFSKKFALEVLAVSKRVSDLWQSFVLPIFYHSDEKSRFKIYTE